MNHTNQNLYQEEYNAIVVGTGMSGGWAAKELCENGLKTLVLERGRMNKLDINYPTTNLAPWGLPNGGNPTREAKEKKLKQNRTGYTTNQGHQHFLVDNIKHTYNEISRFEWIYGYRFAVGGNYNKKQKKHFPLNYLKKYSLNKSSN